jgi:hypothetical protein
MKFMKNVMSDKKSTTAGADLTDPKKDQEKLKQEVTTIDLPEVQDIPGQENIQVPDMREMQDTTISSADEEADDLLRDINTGAANADDRDLNEIIAQEQESAARGTTDSGSSQTAASKDKDGQPKK